MGPYIKDPDREILNSIDKEKILGPLRRLFGDFVGQFSPGYWDRFGSNVEQGLKNQVGRVLESAAVDAPQAMAGFGIKPSIRGQDADRAFWEAMPFGTSSLGPIAGITAYHGSPHKFNKFSMSKIGTGEGAQAYGHGLYFAENPGVAKNYQMNLSAGADDAEQYLLNGKDVRNWFSNNALAREARRQTRAYQKGIGENQSVRNIDSLGEDLKYHAEKMGASPQSMEEIATYINGLKSTGGKVSRMENPGAFYKVDIADDAVKNFLDWDAPLSKQPESVRKALMSDPVIKAKPNMTGREIYEQAARNAPDAFGFTQKAGAHGEASKHLNSLGIKGIRYFDRLSRDAKSGTSNYVVFDEDLVKILSRE